MVGGGRGAFIGAVHRLAATMDGRAALVSGAFSSDPIRSRDSGADLSLDATRVYADYREMAHQEAARDPADRLDFVVIVTPNHEHLAPARLFLTHGFNVVLDKPVTLDLREALELREAVRRSGRVFALTHNYTGNPMVKQARRLVQDGTLGDIRKLVVQYSQGWLAAPLELQGDKQAQWRTDPARSGAAGCLADIGVHAEHLVRYVTGLRVHELCAELTTFVPGRRLDDDGNLLLRFDGGVRGVLIASQIALGDDNDLRLQVIGTQASLEWRQETPDELHVRYGNRPRETWRRAAQYTAHEDRRFTRVPPGHPEGYLEAFANVYREIYRALDAQAEGRPLPADLDLPGIDDGVESMRFLDASVRSARAGGVWTTLL